MLSEQVLAPEFKWLKLIDIYTIVRPPSGTEDRVIAGHDIYKTILFFIPLRDFVEGTMEKWLKTAKGG